MPRCRRRIRDRPGRRTDRSGRDDPGLARRRLHRAADRGQRDPAGARPAAAGPDRALRAPDRPVLPRPRLHPPVRLRRHRPRRRRARRAGVCAHAHLRRAVAVSAVRRPRRDAALVGSVDAFSIAQLLEALGRIRVPRPGGGRCSTPQTWSSSTFGPCGTWTARRRRGATLVLRSPPAFVSRLMELLGPRAVRVEPAGPPERPT